MKFEHEMGEGEARKGEVIKAFHEFSLKFEIAKHQDLVERLADIGEHFHDAVEMARMIDKIWNKLNVDDADRDSLLTATLMHDIGKSGPADIKKYPRLKDAFEKLFPHGDSAANNFGELVEEAGFANADALADILSSDKTPLNKETPAIDFWRYHVEWTYQILKDAGVGEKITRIAASHHILEGKNPAHLADDEISHESKILEVADKYQAHGHRVLAIVDKYQALKERCTKKTHEEIIAFLHRIVDRSSVSEILKTDYHDIIDKVFARAKDDLEKAFENESNSRK